VLLPLLLFLLLMSTKLRTVNPFFVICETSASGPGASLAQAFRVPARAPPAQSASAKPLVSLRESNKAAVMPPYSGASARCTSLGPAAVHTPISEHQVSSLSKLCSSLQGWDGATLLTSPGTTDSRTSGSSSITLCLLEVQDRVQCSCRDRGTTLATMVNDGGQAALHQGLL
jgi:hypothetical protein